MKTVRAGALAARKPNQAAFSPPTARAVSSVAVAESLSKLPEPQLQVLALAYFGGLQVTDIAARLQWPVRHVNVNLKAALGALRHLLSILPGRAAQ
jgi:DNA-directed RNA polymerase specialized sigma24 family protein